jgi:hypothetical protein
MKDKDPLPLTVGQMRKIWPHLRRALLRRQFQPAVDKLGLDFFSNSPDPLFTQITQACTPPRDQTEENFMLLADLATGLLFKEIPRVIQKFLIKALPEVKEAYDAIRKAEGGWSSYKGSPEKRQAAVLQWYQENRGRLQILNEKHLDNWNLYRERDGQEKRNFQTWLLQDIVKSKYSCEMLGKDIEAYLKSLQGGDKLIEGLLKEASS